MSLFSFLRKNKPETASGDSTYYSRAEEDSKAVRSRGKRRASRGAVDDVASDPVLPEKKRARRRLIGAVALVLAAVIGLPMLLDSEPRPLTDDIAIQIPSKDKPAGGVVARPESAVNAASRVAASASLDAKEEVVEPSAVQAASDTKATDQADKAAEKATEKAADKPAATVARAEADAAEPAARDADTARARALLEGKPDPKAETADKAGDRKPVKFVVQVAALASKEKVDELQGKLKGAGIKSFTQKVATESGDRTRIRVGPFASREEAEKVRAKIVKLGLNGTLVPA